MFLSSEFIVFLKKKLYVPDAVLEISIEFFFEQFSKQIQQQSGKKKKLFSRRGYVHPCCPDSLLMMVELVRATGILAPWAHSILWHVTVFILKKKAFCTEKEKDP